MTEQDKMLAGRMYDSSDAVLFAKRSRAHKICQEYNLLADTDERERAELLNKLIPNCKEGVYLQGPIYFDYGEFTYIGENTYANFNFTVLDICPVTIGDNVFIGPNCSLVTPMHPLRHEQRNIRFREDKSPYDYEYGKPITIGDNCWLASNVVVIGGVTIGEGCVIGAGSVVTRDIPPNSLAAGNPCRVIRKITDEDLMDMT